MPLRPQTFDYLQALTRSLVLPNSCASFSLPSSPWALWSKAFGILSSSLFAALSEPRAGLRPGPLSGDSEDLVHGGQELRSGRLVRHPWTLRSHRSVSFASCRRQSWCLGQADPLSEFFCPLLGQIAATMCLYANLWSNCPRGWSSTGRHHCQSP